MGPKTSLDDELKAINDGLHDSYERLSVLLQKSRSELMSGNLKLGDFAHKNLTSVIQKLELKLEELKELGAGRK